MRVASIGEMHLTFNQGIKARLLGDSLFQVLFACGEHSATRNARLRRMDLWVSCQGVYRPPPTDNAPAALPHFGNLTSHFSLARKRPTCGAQTLPVRPFFQIHSPVGECSAARRSGYAGWT